jgi:hypothetical protein
MFLSQHNEHVYAIYTTKPLDVSSSDAILGPTSHSETNEVAVQVVA